MDNPGISREALKQAMKEALTELLEENRELFREALAEALEDAGMIAAIKEGRDSEPVAQERVMRILRAE